MHRKMYINSGLLNVSEWLYKCIESYLIKYLVIYKSQVSNINLHKSAL